MSVAIMRHCQVRIQGIVQGVGFRPFVYRVATEFNLNGTVLNNGQGVTIELYGIAHMVEQCITTIVGNPPPLARIDSVETFELASTPPENGFHIIDSEASSAATVALSADMATCEDCLADIADPQSRFYRYPFTNCTNCGPRYSIIRQLPYDRKATSMATFVMCEHCKTQYHDPLDRRYHAQPISCPQCGPQLRYVTNEGSELAKGEKALVLATKALAQGKILAVKGLGGFHLMCDATNESAVQQLRLRKQRPVKPLAVMVKDGAMAKQIVSADANEWQSLTSQQRPIVLLSKLNCEDSTLDLASCLAPGIDCLGVFLPYTPLHTLLFDGLSIPLVATSANISGEPILTSSDAVLRQLGHVVDAIIDHDRDIEHPCDDSVVQVIDGNEMVLRLGRGYAPLSVALPKPVLNPTFASGAQQKNSLALAFNQQMMLSPYIGDLDSLSSELHYQQTYEFFSRCYDFTASYAVHDLHPDYIATRFTKRLAATPISVQHHYAHVLAQMAINQQTEPVLGFAFDGTGLGDDGTVWGGEVMLADAHAYQRIASLKPFKLIGGDNAVKDPTRLLLSLLFERYNDEQILAFDLAALKQVEPLFIRNLYRLWSANSACIATSSMGRLFDAVARLLGLIGQTQFEGEAGIKLAMYGQKALDITQGDDMDLRFQLPLIIENGRQIWDSHALFAQIVAAVKEKPLTESRISLISFGFIQALADAVCLFTSGYYQSCSKAEPRPSVVLCGGVFQNRLLYSLCTQQLTTLGVDLLPHKQLPVNDASIAFGQLWYGIHNEQ